MLPVANGAVRWAGELYRRAKRSRGNQIVFSPDLLALL
jgi:hypothetical protein